MFKVCTRMICVLLIISNIFAKRKNNNSEGTTANPLSNISNKFHQSDFKLTLEWSETVRVNKSFVDYHKYTFKYNRTTTAINVTFIGNAYLGYDLELIAQAYKFASNEYRLFPLRFQFNLCDAIAKQAMGFDKVSRYGNLSCPLVKGKRYHYYNWTPEERRFPPFIPTGKYMLEIEYLYNLQELLVTRDYGSGKRYRYYNWTPEETTYPPFIPTEKYMIEVKFVYYTQELLVTRDYGSINRPFL